MQYFVIFEEKVKKASLFNEKGYINITFDASSEEEAKVRFEEYMNDHSLGLFDPGDKEDQRNTEYTPTKTFMKEKGDYTLFRLNNNKCTPYVVAYKYDILSDDWRQGHYFGSYKNALDFLKTK